jgi:hypothetical protein
MSILGRLFKKHNHHVLVPHTAGQKHIDVHVGGLKIGQFVQVDVIPTGHEFSINFKAGKDIYLHFNPRYHHSQPNEVIMNAHFGSSWGHQEKTGGLPFASEQEGQITFHVEQDHFHVLVNGVEFATFAHRHPFNEITMVECDGDVKVKQLQVFGGPHTESENGKQHDQQPCVNGEPGHQAANEQTGHPGVQPQGPALGETLTHMSQASNLSSMDGGDQHSTDHPQKHHHHHKPVDNYWDETSSTSKQDSHASHLSALGDEASLNKEHEKEKFWEGENEEPTPPSQIMPGEIDVNQLNKDHHHHKKEQLWEGNNEESTVPQPTPEETNGHHHHEEKPYWS